MFVLLSRYVRPIAEVDAVLAAHREWIGRQYAAGRFLASGRRVDGTGGVIVAQASCEDELRQLLEDDPYVQGGVAEYAIHEFAQTDFPLRSTGLDVFLRSTPV
jgi:uncharacterized protein YciI